MQFKGVIAMLAFTAMAANAAPVKARQELDIDQALDQVEDLYNNPQYIESYGSQVMSLVSAQMTETNPSEADVYSAFLSLKASMGPSLVSKAVDSMDAIIEQLGVGGQEGAQLSQIMSQMHNTSVISRLSDMINKMLDKVAEEYKEGDIGTPTAGTNDDKESQAGDKSSKGDDDESETSAASSKTMGMFVMSVGAVAGAMVALF